jgi:hypothetical protein
MMAETQRVQPPPDLGRGPIPDVQRVREASSLMRRRLELLFQLEEIPKEDIVSLATKRERERESEGRTYWSSLVTISSNEGRSSGWYCAEAVSEFAPRDDAPIATFQQDCRIALISGVVPAGTLGSLPSSRTARAT